MVKLHLIFDNINTWKADKFLFTLNTDHKSLHLAESTWKKIPINNWYHQIAETLQKSSDYLCQVSNSQSTHPALKTNYPRSVPYYPVLSLTSAKLWLSSVSPPIAGCLCCSRFFLCRAGFPVHLLQFIKWSSKLCFLWWLRWFSNKNRYFMSATVAKCYP